MMTTEEFSNKISRELGSIDSRLKNIEEGLNRHSVSHEQIWEKIDLIDTQVEHLKEKQIEYSVSIKVSSFLISVFCSVIVGGIPVLIRILK